MTKKRRNASVKEALPSRIWWAYDCAIRHDASHLHTLKVLAPFLSALKTTVTPVTVLDPYHADAKGDPITAMFPVLKCDESQFKRQVVTRLGKLIQASEVCTINEPVLLFNIEDTPPSLRDKAALISRAAKRAGAEVIAIRTHQRKGLAKFFMGSFSETFSAVSTLPTLLIPGSARPERSIKKVLFASDFSNSSREAFANFLPLAKGFGATITIVHYLGWREASETLIAEDSALSQAEGLVTMARHFRVKAAASIIHQSDSFDPASQIVEYGRKTGQQLIALVSQSGPIRASLLGATSREIARSSSIPVLLYRPTVRD